MEANLFRLFLSSREFISTLVKFVPGCASKLNRFIKVCSFSLKSRWSIPGYFFLFELSLFSKSEPADSYFDWGLESRYNFGLRAGDFNFGDLDLFFFLTKPAIFDISILLFLALCVPGAKVGLLPFLKFLLLLFLWIFLAILCYRSKCSTIWALILAS